MPEDEPIDYKLLTMSTVVVQNLNIDLPPPETPELADLCKLPKVHLENLNLGMAPRVVARPKLPRVLLEKLDLDVPWRPNSLAAGVPRRQKADTVIVPPRQITDTIIVPPRQIADTVSVPPRPNAAVSVPPRQNPATVKRTPRQNVNAIDVPHRPNTPQPCGDNLHESFTKFPVVLIRRCETPPAPVRKKVSFNLPPPDKKTTLPARDKAYKLVGPYRGVEIKTCRVRVQRDDLNKLKATWNKKPKRPTSCKLCGKVYFSKKKLGYHQERKHYLVSSVAPAEKKRQVSFSMNVTVHTVPYHRCRKCLKVFKTYKILSQHMKSEHRKRTCYICDYCTKLFADRTIFKVHIKLHCDKCGRLFLEKRELTLHRKTICFMRKTRKIKCASCDDIFYSTLAVKDHSYSHMEVGKLICDICKEHFSTACSLIRHLFSSHTNKKKHIATSELYTVVKTGSLKVYTCKWCAEAYIDESDIVKHVNSDETATAGGFEKKYGDHRCEYCPKKFKIEKNLIQHMWTHLQSTVDGERGSKTAERHQTIELRNEQETDMATEMALARNGVVDKTEKEVKSAAKKNENGPQHKRSKQEGYKREEETKRNDLVMNGTQYSIVSTSSPKKKKKRNNFQAVCPKCNKTFSRKHGLKRHMNTVHEDLERMHCRHCEEVFAWPSLLRNHRCLRAVAPVEPRFQEVPVVIPDSYNSFGLDDELPANGDVTTEIDFDIPAPMFEFAGIPEPFPRDVYQLSPAPTTRGYKYKVVRQEIAIEF